MSSHPGHKATGTFTHVGGSHPRGFATHPASRKRAAPRRAARRQCAKRAEAQVEAPGPRLPQRRQRRVHRHRRGVSGGEARRRQIEARGALLGQDGQPAAPLQVRASRVEPCVQELLWTFHCCISFESKGSDSHPPLLSHCLPAAEISVWKLTASG